MTYEDQHGSERTIRIVRVDEAIIEDNLVSWVSPIARAMMRKALTDVAILQTSHSAFDIELLDIKYEACR